MSRSRSGRGGFRAGRSRGSSWRKLFDITLAAAVLGLLALVAARFEAGETQRVEGAAVVNDGDSITLGSERIRLRGIDAPELDQICLAGAAEYPCGRRARDALVEAVGGRVVTCTGRSLDRYDRLLATCSVGGADLNRLQVEAGWAVAYGDFEAEEETARRNGAGLWAGAFDLPKEWREKHGGMVESEHGAIRRMLEGLRQILRFS